MDLADANILAHAALNFAGDRSDGGVWSNHNPAITTQKLTAHEVIIRDARHLATAPSITAEGFQIQRALVGGYDWYDQTWLTQIYLPHCLELVRQVTGATRVVPVHASVLIRDTGNSAFAPAAQFIHIDQDRAAAAMMVAMAAGEDQAVASASRTAIFNVWRSKTPPPQDVPLAIADQRTLEEADWVVGKTVEPQMDYATPYVSSVFNPRQRWFYFSDMDVDEALVFKNYDSDKGRPLGCLHGAFRLPAMAAGTVPHASAEIRVIACFN